MAMLLVCELLTLRFAMHTLSAARALVGGEGLWSKAQKSGAISLLSYGETHDDADFRAFLAAFEVPDGDHQARLSLLSPSPDLAGARSGFHRGRLDDADIDEVIDLLRRFAWTSYLTRAIEIWTRGDELLAGFRTVGLDYHAAVVAGDRARSSALLLQLKEINGQLTSLEDEFSFILGAGSRWLEYLVLTLLSVAVLLVESIGLTLTFLTARSISRRLLALNTTAIQIGHGQFAQPPLPASLDEIGQLARSLDQMGEMLQRSHSELEARVAERTRELVRSRDQLDIVLKGITDGITVIDDRGQFVYVNDAGARMCGFSSRAEFLSTPQSKFAEIFEMMDEAGNPFPLEKLPSRLAFAGVESPPEAIVRFRLRRGGEERWSIVKSSPVFDEERNAKLVVTIFKDFSDRKRAEEAVRFLDEASRILGSSIDYQTTLRSVATLAVPRLADWCQIELLDEQNVPQPLALVHADPEKIGLATELRQRYPHDVARPQGAARVIATGKAVLANDIGDEQIAGFARDPGHLAGLRALGIVSVMIVPVATRGKAFGAITLVSAESKRHYSGADLVVAEELARRVGAAIENARLYQIAQDAIASRDEFLSIASHELKTPLTALKLEIHLAKRKIRRADAAAPASPALAEALEHSGRQVDRLTNLIEDLMDVSRIQSGRLEFRFELVDLSDVIRDVAARYSELLSRVGSSLTLEIAEAVRGSFDRTRIEQLLENLLTNATKYAPGKPVEVSLGRSAGTATLIVADHGPGISRDLQPRIFERFERAGTSGDISGLGLGLFIARKIVDGHGGSIEVQSEGGQGSRFIVRLPLSRDTEVASAT